MSDAAEPDAWAVACEEDLAAERERHERLYGPPRVDAGEELRRLADAVARTAGALVRPLGGPAGETAVRGAAEQLLAQARAAVRPALERNPDVLDHLTAAGGELLAAYRSAVYGRQVRDPAKRPQPPETGGKRTDGE
jgi:hypothetical protein